MRHRVELAALLIAGVAFVPTAAVAAEAPPTVVTLQGQRYTVDVADDDAERTRGLSFREAMAVDHGMLFIHDYAMPRAYWMRDMRFALDILYFDDERRLVTQYRDVPPCTLGDACPTYPSTGSVRYVLELNAGQAARLGLSEGATLQWPPGRRDDPTSTEPASGF